MHLWLVVLGLCALSAAAPQNWPYRDSLMPYRYGYPGQSQYKYLPEVEDDEDTGPYLSRLHGRQDLVVGSEGDRVKPTSEPGVSVIETGSVPPVVEPNKYTRPPQAPSPTHKPVGVDTGRPVQPPPFPAARPPPTPPPSAKPDEEEEDDESEEDADDDVEVEDEEADDGDADADEEEGDNEDDEEEERRRQEPLNIKSEKVVEPVPVAPVAPVVPPTVAPVVPANQTAVVNGSQSVVPKPTGAPEAEEDASSEEQGLPGIEALVPGYVTDQGEVLVPVDTVTGDQPIAIVPDPYGQPTRGVALNRQPSYRGPYDESDDYEAPYYFSDIYGGLRRQAEDSDEVDSDVEAIRPTKGHGKVPVAPSDEKNRVVEVVDEQETDDEDVVTEGSATKETDSLEAELEGRNEFMTAFPPSRTPELFAYINSRIPVDQSSDYPYDDYFQQQSGEYNGPYAYQQQIRQQPRPSYYYRPRPQSQSPSVTLAVALSGNNQQQRYNNVPYRRYQQQQGYSGYPYGSYEESGEVYRPTPSQFYRRPVPSMYRPNQYSGYQQGPIYRPNQFSGYQQGPVYRPNQFNGYQQQFGGYDRPIYRPFVGYGQGGPSVYKPRPNVVGRPVGQGNKQNQGLGYLRPTAVRITPLRRPTPVIKQKKHPVESQSNEMPYGFANDSVDVSSGAQDSYEEPKFVSRKVAGKNSAVVKSRRAAKMAKKPNKKLLESKKATADPDPLNILKKINANAKRS